jgi:transposase-like protein
MKRTVKRHGEEFWKSHAVAREQSGKSRRQYCLEHGLSLETFRRWTHRFNSGKPQTTHSFVQLPPELYPKPVPAQEAATLELLIDNRFVLRIGHSCRREVLRMVLDELGVRQ